MKKLRMIVTSVIVLAIVSSAFAFNAKKLAKFCVSNDSDTTCDQILDNSKRITGTANFKYIADWDGAACTSQTTCTTSVDLVHD
jgi:cell division septal protein FtsQ